MLHRETSVEALPELAGVLINEKVLNCWKCMLKLSSIRSIHVKKLCI